MSVAILTLGLVIVVEFVLHTIDHSAIGKPFYQAVLDAVYRECKYMLSNNRKVCFSFVVCFWMNEST